MPANKHIQVTAGLLPEDVGPCMFCGAGIVKPEHEGATGYYDPTVRLTIARVRERAVLVLCKNCSRDLAHRTLMAHRRYKERTVALNQE